MTKVRIQHIYNHKSGLAVDDVVNTFYFSGAGTLDATSAGVLVGHVANFYNATPSGVTNPIRFYIASSTMLANRDTFVVYNMDDAKPRVPVFTSTPVPAVANNVVPALPGEVALCLSYRANTGSGQVAARRRGRLYIGPLNTGVLAADANGNARPVATVLDVWTQAGKALQDAADTSGWKWSVYSSKIGESDFPALAYSDIAEVSCDNAFDTQRRRGVSSTARTIVAT